MRRDMGYRGCSRGHIKEGGVLACLDRTRFHRARPCAQGSHWRAFTEIAATPYVRVGIKGVGAACFFMRKHGPLFRPRAANRARSLPAFSSKKRRLLILVLSSTSIISSPSSSIIAGFSTVPSSAFYQSPTMRFRQSHTLSI